jgi:hypothetical protein
MALPGRGSAQTNLLSPNAFDAQQKSCVRQTPAAPPEREHRPSSRQPCPASKHFVGIESHRMFGVQLIGEDNIDLARRATKQDIHRGYDVHSPARGCDIACDVRCGSTDRDRCVVLFLGQSRADWHGTHVMWVTTADAAKLLRLFEPCLLRQCPQPHAKCQNCVEVDRRASSLTSCELRCVRRAPLASAVQSRVWCLQTLMLIE